MDAEERLIFRYDNAEHYPALPNAPHHKHTGSENTVVASAAPRLDAVLAEVELMVRVWESKNDRAIVALFLPPSKAVNKECILIESDAPNLVAQLAADPAHPQFV